MKKIHRPNLFAFLAIFLLTSLATSCADEPVIADSNLVAPVTMKNGYLQFESQETFDRIKDKLKHAPVADVIEWENQFAGFTSQRSLYDKAIAEELKYADAFEQASDGQIAHSSFVEQNLKSFILQDEGGFELNLPHTEEFLSPFVNKDGLVKIGDQLHKYTQNSIKVILDGDESKLANLEKVIESNAQLGIMVYNITYFVFDKTVESGRKQFEGNDQCTGYTSGGGQRVVGKVIGGCTAVVDINGSLGYPGQVVTKTTLKTTATNQMKKGFLGWVSYQTYQLAIYGTVHVSAANGGTFEVAASSPNNNTSYLEYIIWETPWIPTQCNSFPFLYSGSLEFYGRDYSYCDI